jgi:hypothetical protein
MTTRAKAGVKPSHAGFVACRLGLGEPATNAASALAFQSPPSMRCQRKHVKTALTDAHHVAVDTHVKM